MTDYYCNDDGDNTTGTSWATAKTTFAGALALAGSSDRIFIKHDHAESLGSNTTYTGPTSGQPVFVVSASGTGTAYQVASNIQITTTGNQHIKFDGSFSLYGISVRAGNYVHLDNGADEFMLAQFCTFDAGDAASFQPFICTGQNQASYIGNCTINLDATSASANNPIRIQANGFTTFEGCTFTPATATDYTGPIFDTSTASSRWGVLLIGCDISGFTSCSSVIGSVGRPYPLEIDGCKLPSGVAIKPTAFPEQFSNVVSTRSDGNTYHVAASNNVGDCTSSTANVITTGGASDGTSYSWLVTTDTNCSNSVPFVTPWMAAWATTSDGTFDVYINSDDVLTDTQCWLEVEYLATSSSSATSLVTSRNSDILAAGTTLTADTSTWTTNNNRYKLSVSATPLTNGVVRARVWVAADITDNLYIDPQIRIS